MNAVATHEPMSRAQFKPFVDLARQACARWGIVVPSGGGSVTQEAILVRDALHQAARVVSAEDGADTYAGDVPGLVGALPGLSLESLRADIEEGRNQGDEWGVCFRVEADDLVFDVPLVFGMDEDAARSILAEIDGREHEFVCIDDIADMAESESVRVHAHADSWRYMKNMARDHAIDLTTALAYRRPGAWDLFRGEMTEIVPRMLPLWSEDDFQARYLLSMRYDMDGMADSRKMLALYAMWSPEPFSTEWSSWFPQITDLLHAVGAPRAIYGMSVILHFSVQEATLDDWEAVNARNVVVACSLDPIQANALLEYVKMDPEEFHDLADTEDKRFVLMAVSAVPDAMLASIRATSSGRSGAYDRLVDAMIRKEDAEEIEE